MAIPAGFEPATHGVEIRYSNKSALRLASCPDLERLKGSNHHLTTETP
jgi:hypothetical protein